jgi:hypothetical protein
MATYAPIHFEVDASSGGEAIADVAMAGTALEPGAYVPLVRKMRVLRKLV